MYDDDVDMCVKKGEVNIVHIIILFFRKRKKNSARDENAK